MCSGFFCILSGKTPVQVCSGKIFGLYLSLFSVACFAASPRCSCLVGLCGYRRAAWYLSFAPTRVSSFIRLSVMKTPIDMQPLYTYVNEEMTPLDLLKCLNGLSIDYTRLLIGKMEEGDPRQEVDRETYNYLYEIHRLSVCLIEGMRRAQNQQARGSLGEPEVERETMRKRAK